MSFRESIIRYDDIFTSLVIWKPYFTLYKNGGADTVVVSKLRIIPSYHAANKAECVRPVETSFRRLNVIINYLVPQKCKMCHNLIDIQLYLASSTVGLLT